MLCRVSTTILSKDIQSLVQADKINDNYTIKRKILWGPDGVGNDVTLATPFPVQGTLISTPASWSNFSQGTPKTVDVTDVSTILLSSNPNRIFLRIINNSDSVIYIQYGINAVFRRGLPLFTNGVLEDTIFLGQINAITDTGLSVNIDVMEGII